MTQLLDQARYLDEPPPDDDADPSHGVRARLTTGASFILDAALDTPCLWGTGELVLWAELESLMISGPPGVGKTTIAQQLVLAAIGIGTPELLGFPVTAHRRVLYLAMDRPRQIAKSFRRMVTETDREALDERLAIWQGPPPTDIAKSTGMLLYLAQAAAADVIVIDSLKDAALGLVNDEVGAAVNRAIQTVLVAGIDVIVLHHQTKRSGSGDGGKPTSLADVYGSAWITAGAGSVILIHGEAGDRIVELRHLKTPSEPVGPLKIEHNTWAGTSTLLDGQVDPLIWLRTQHTPVTAQHLGQMYADPGHPADAKHVQRARRDLERLTRAGMAIETAGHKGGHSGGTPTTWRPAAKPHQAELPQDPQ
jgi:replicative DNA helicase